MSAPLLQVENLTVEFGHGEGIVDAVRDISFEIRAGERFALVGESGSGKSVTALSILRLAQEARLGGRVVFDGEDLLAKTEREMRGIRGARIAMVFQEPMTALNPLYTIGTQIVEAIELHEGLGRAEATQRAIALLQRTGIPEPERRFHSYPHQLSGGQRQRAMIAVALACRPALLLADEPTTALDVSIQAQIIDLLRELQAEFGMAIMLITHDLNLVRRFAQRVGVMEKGRLVECADTANLFASPQHAYTERLINSRPRREILPLMPLAPVMLEAQAVCVDFPRRQSVNWLRPAMWFRPSLFRAVDGISLELRQGETLGIVGESGSGKTTLAMALLGLQKIGAGEIRIQGESLSGMTSAQRMAMRARMQVVFQDPFGALSPRMTIADIVAEGLRLHHPGMPEEECLTQVIGALREVGLDRTALGRYPHEFSGGQRQRIAIARVLVLRPQILVLDEPTSALDVSVQQQILKLLAALQRKYNLSYLFISHDLAVIRAMSHRVAVLKEGKVVEIVETEELFAAPNHPYTRLLHQASTLDEALP